MKRIEWIDMARGIGIVLVMLGHFSDFVYLNCIIYTFHVPLFFFISGLVFEGCKKSTVKFISSEIKRIFIPYWVWALLLFILPELLLDYIKTHQISYENQLNFLTMSRPGTGTLWFFSALLSVHIIAFVILKLSKDREWVLFLISVILFAGFYCYYKLGYEELWLNIDVACMAMIFFSVGYVCKKKINILQKILSLKYVKLTVLFIVLLSVNIVTGLANYKILNDNVNMWSNEYGNPVLMLISAFCGIFAVVIFSNLFIAKPICYLGKNSVSFFIPHQQIYMFILRYILPLIGFDPELNLLNKAVNLIASFFFIVILCFIVNEILVRIPLAPLFGLKKRAKIKKSVADNQ